MADFTSSGDMKLTPGGLEVKTLADQIMTFARPGKLVLEHYLGAAGDAWAIRQVLAAGSVGKLLLPKGASLSAVNLDGRMPDLGLYVTEATLDTAGIAARAWNAADGYWRRELETRFNYSNGKHTAQEAIVASVDCGSVDKPPKMSRTLFSMTYAESGYEQHGYMGMPEAGNREAMEFAAFAQAIFDTQA